VLVGGAIAGGCDGVLSRGTVAGGAGVTGRDGSVGAGVPRAVLCVAPGGGDEDEGDNTRISPDSPRKPMAIAAAPYVSILPRDGPPLRGCERG